MTKKRFWSEYYNVGYYTEIVDSEKELEDVPNPQKNLTIGEVIDLLNKLYEDNLILRSKINTFEEHQKYIYSSIYGKELHRVAFNPINKLNNSQYYNFKHDNKYIMVR